MAYNIKKKKTFETGFEKPIWTEEDYKKAKERKANKSFSINAHNYSWDSDGKTMKVSLGNLSDAGWYWNGDQKDLNGFLFRLNHSAVKDEFLGDMQKEGITFEQVKPQLIKNAKSNDGFYEMSGDNVVWHFGQIDGDVDESYELEESGITDEKQKDAVYSEYSPVKIDEFEKSNKKNFQEKMEKAIKESNTFEEFMQKQDEIQQDLIEERMSENQGRFLEAIDKVKEKK